MNPYHPPVPSQARPDSFSWRASLIGGAAAIGGMAILGTAVANASLWIYMQSGMTIEQAYAAISASCFSLNAVLSGLVQIASAYSGGYVAAKYGGGGHTAQSAVTGLIADTFFLIMLTGPGSTPPSIGFFALSMALPVAAALAGGMAWSRAASKSHGGPFTSA